MFKEEYESRFEVLHKKFVEAVRWINKNFKSSDIKKHIEAFEEKVSQPMDLAWEKLTDSQKQLFFNQI